MKKLIIITILLISALVYFSYMYGWLGFYVTTKIPKKYVNTAIVSGEYYKNDIHILVSLFNNALVNQEGFFNNKSYFDSTKIIIDTILYSPDFSKIAVFVVVKNPTSKQISPDLVHRYYYDATCYLGTRKNIVYDLSWVGPTFTNSINYQTVSNNIRNACLKTFVTTDGKYKYNMNDKRFWTSSIWIKFQ